MRIRVGGVELGYERAGEGQGEPVLLVMGLGTSRIGWFQQMPVLAASGYDVIAFDNRGVGESDAPAQGWTMADMANDAVGLMDAVGYDRAHIVGVSMGGMISQELALRHPDRIRSLTLISTHHGGPDTELPSPEVLAALSNFEDPKERIRAGVWHTFGRRYRETHPEVVEMAIQFAISNPSPMHGLLNQVMAIAGWQAEGGVAALLGDLPDVPVAVLHGEDDEIVPVGNGERLASAVPGAELRIWPDAGHALIQERAEEVNELLLKHLASAS